MERAHLQDEDEARRLIDATLVTLAERITADEARDLAAQLPEEVQPLLVSGAGERFGDDEFVRRVMVRADIDAGRAGVRTAAVLGVLRDAVSPGEWGDVLSQLPGDPVQAMPGTVPASATELDMGEALSERSQGGRWQPSGAPGEWCATTDDGMKQGMVRRAGDGFEARVYRYPTGPTGAQPELSNGPQVFPTAPEALDYAEAEMGW